MKNNPFTIFTAGMAAMLAGPALAIEAPADDAPPPPAAVGAPAAEVQEQAPAAEVQEQAPAAVAEATAYLGVESAQVPEMLAEHLGLKPGEGVCIRSVMPDGPAAKAGLKEHDIILRVGGEAIGNIMDLTREVTSHKPEEVVRFDLIQKGKPSNLDVTLGTRPANFGEANHRRGLDQLNLEGLPKDMAERVLGLIEGKIGGLQIDPGGGAAEVVPQMDRAVREMKLRLEKAMEGLDGPLVPGMPGGATMRLLDQKGSVELKSNGEGKEVTVRDKENNITWTGPWDTEQDKAAAPDDVRQRLERLNLDSNFKGQGMRFKFDARPLEEDGE